MASMYELANNNGTNINNNNNNINYNHNHNHTTTTTTTTTKTSTLGTATSTRTTRSAAAATNSLNVSPVQKRRKIGTSNPKNLNSVARECQRMGISTRAAATLINAYKKDSGDTDPNNVVDRNKIVRAIDKCNDRSTNSHRNAINTFIEDHAVYGLFFDGKKDKSNVYTKNEGTMRNHLRKETEDHYTLVFQPSSVYYTHITISDGKAESIATQIWNKVQCDQICSDKLLFIGCDGTNVNTGHSGGSFRFLNINTNIQKILL